MDFISDILYNGRKHRLLNIIDDFNRECLGIEVNTSLPAGRVVRTLDRVVEWRGMPNRIRVEDREASGPEFNSSTLEVWCEEYEVNLQFIPPGKPQ